MQVGYHASHEQFAPSELLRNAERAERCGFGAVLSSDHLAPWSRQQGHAGFAWTWLGAVAARTGLDLGVVAAPGDRYHPAVLAQAIATVAELAPGRLTPALGSGEALNEHVTGSPWPAKAERNARLAECARVIRDLLAGKRVDHAGLVRVADAELFTLPPRTVPLFAAALTPASARHVAAWADGLITVDAPDSALTAVIEAFREAAGEALPVHVQLHLSWAGTQAEARDQAVACWRTNALRPELTQDLTSPDAFDAATERVSAADLEDSVLISADPARCADRLGELAALGVDRVYLHQVGPDQERFIDTFGERVLPEVRP